MACTVVSFRRSEDRWTFFYGFGNFHRFFCNDPLQPDDGVFFGAVIPSFVTQKRAFSFRGFSLTCEALSFSGRLELAITIFVGVEDKNGLMVKKWSPSGLKTLFFWRISEVLSFFFLFKGYERHGRKFGISTASPLPCSKPLEPLTPRFEFNSSWLVWIIRWPPVSSRFSLLWSLSVVCFFYFVAKSESIPVFFLYVSWMEGWAGVWPPYSKVIRLISNSLAKRCWLWHACASNQTEFSNKIFKWERC